VIADGELRPFDDVSHFLMIEKLAEINRCVLAFLRRNGLLKS
jgi:pimeloyl-ACP methyl ester carboxylesterase